MVGRASADGCIKQPLAAGVDWPLLASLVGVADMASDTRQRSHTRPTNPTSIAAASRLECDSRLMGASLGCWEWRALLLPAANAWRLDRRLMGRTGLTALRLRLLRLPE